MYGGPHNKDYDILGVLIWETTIFSLHPIITVEIPVLAPQAIHTSGRTRIDVLKLEPTSP